VALGIDDLSSGIGSKNTGFGRLGAACAALFFDIVDGFLPLFLTVAATLRRCRAPRSKTRKH
ncbi:hypothetical protein, partial [Rhodothalassium salexigens]|uniref:hypothetical protein n=1 Tax=Rhodothalassium salexigens TaxID=1086 RepID=UPI001A9279DD